MRCREPAARLVLVGALGLFLPAPAVAAALPLPVTVTLRNGGFSFHDIAIRATSFDLTVRNAGSKKHALAIAGKGRNAPLKIETETLAPGASTKLVLRLPPGRYRIYSPLDRDRAHGLTAPMKIMSPSPPGSDGAEMDRVFYNY